MTRLRVCCALCVVLGSVVAASAQQAANASGAVLRGLDKYSGEVVDITLPVGTSAKFGRLIVTLTECRFPAGDPSGNAFAGLQILEDGKDEIVFSGWMVASSPALNALEHPRYDIWVMRCTTS